MLQLYDDIQTAPFFCSGYNEYSILSHMWLKKKKKNIEMFVTWISNRNRRMFTSHLSRFEKQALPPSASVFG